MTKVFISFAPMSYGIATPEGKVCNICARAKDGQPVFATAGESPFASAPRQF